MPVFCFILRRYNMCKDVRNNESKMASSKTNEEKSANASSNKSSTSQKETSSKTSGGCGCSRNY